MTFDKTIEKRKQQCIEIAFLLSNGLYIQDAATELNISRRVAENRLMRGWCFFGAKNTPHLIALLFRKKILS